MPAADKYSLRIIGAGAVAPGGVGSTFFKNLADADQASGIRSLNTHLAGKHTPDQQLIADVQPVYTRYLMRQVGWGKVLMATGGSNKDKWLREEAEQQVEAILALIENETSTGSSGPDRSPAPPSRPGAAAAPTLAEGQDSWFDCQACQAAFDAVKKAAIAQPKGSPRDLLSQLGQDERMAVLEYRFCWYREEFLFGPSSFPKRIEVHTRLAESSSKADSRPVKEHRDIFGIVPSASLLPWLLPLEGMIFQDEIAAMGLFDRHVIDALFLSLPRSVGLALVSTFQGLLDAAGLLEELEKELLENQKTNGFVEHCARHLTIQDAPDDGPNTVGLRCYETISADTVVSFVEAAIPLFRRFLQDALKILRGENGRRIGLVLGSAGGNVEVMAGYAIRLHELGLKNNIEFENQEFDDNTPFFKTDPKAPFPGKMGAMQLTNEMRQVNHNYTAGLLCRVFKLDGDQLTVSTSCCSGQTALITAARYLDSDARRGRPSGGRSADLYVVTGVDCALWPEYYAGFHWLGVLARLKGDFPSRQEYKHASTPYRLDESAGWVFGEGAGTVVISTAEVGDELGAGMSRRPVSVTAWYMANSGTEDPWNQSKRDALEATLGQAPAGRGLVLSYGLGDRQAFDLCEVLNLMVAINANQGTAPATLFSLKEGQGHSMGGSSALAAALAYRVLSRRCAKLDSRHDPKKLQTIPGAAKNKKFRGQYDTWTKRMGDARTNGSTAATDVQFIPPGGLSEDELKLLPWVLLNGSGLGGTVDSVLLEPVPAQTGAPAAASGAELEEENAGEP